MSISSINTSIASAAQSPQVPNLKNSINSSNNNATPPTTATVTTSATTPAKLGSDWLKIKEATGIEQTIKSKVAEASQNELKVNSTTTTTPPTTTVITHDDASSNNFKISKTTTSNPLIKTVPPKPATTANIIKHKLVSTASTNSSGNIRIQLAQPASVIATSLATSTSTVIQPAPTTTLTISAPKAIIKSTNPIPTTVSSPNTTAVNLTQLSKNNQAPSNNANTPPSTGSLNIPTTVNMNNRKINVAPTTANTKITLSNPSNSNSNTSNTINNLVKNILSANSSPSNTATSNAAVAVTAAANIFSQMNTDKVITKNSNGSNNNAKNNNEKQVNSIITTLMTNNNVTETSGNNNSADQACIQQQPQNLVTKLQNTNQINLPTATLNLNNTQAQSQMPKITVLSSLSNSNQSTKTTIKTSQNRVIDPSTITKATVPISLKPSTTATGQSHQHLIPINSSTNGQISNIVSGINLKSLSPISFLPITSPNDTTPTPLGFVNSKISNIATARGLQNATPPPTTTSTPITITNNNNQPVTISTANISNYISKTPNNINSGNVYKTISNVNSSGSTEPEETLNSVPTVHNFTNSNSQTIAQLCSGLNNQFQIQQSGTGSTLQPIRLIPNNQQANQISQSSKIYQNNVQLQQITLNSSMFNTTNNNNNNINNINHNQPINAAQLGKKPTVNSISNNCNMNISSIPQTNSSPSASPLKPNIIRKPRRDSPNHANLLSNNEHPHQILNVQASNLYNQSSTKHPIYEMTQNAIIDNANNKQTTVHLSSLTDEQKLQTGDSTGQQNIISLPSSSSVSSSSTLSTTATNSSSSKSIVNLIAESSPSTSNFASDMTKSIRKFTLNTQLNIPSANPTIKDSWATSSSIASSSSSCSHQNIQNDQSTNNNNSKNSTIQLDLPSSSTQPTSSPTVNNQSNQSHQQNSDSNLSIPTNSPATAQLTSRKRRKQEFKKNSDDNLVSFNSNPLSNNSALAYSMSALSPNTNRYLNENTNISNNNSGANQHNPQQQPLNITTSNVKLNSKQSYNKNIDSDTNSIDNTDICLIGSEDHMHVNKKMRSAITTSVDSNKLIQVSNENIISMEGVKIINEKKPNDNDAGESSDSCLDDESVRILSKEFSYVASNGVTWASKRNRSKQAISECYKNSWKPRNNHYLRYSDIKMKDKIKKPAVNTITQKELIDNLNEWKFHFVISQVKNLIEFENESLHVIEDVENLMQDEAFFNGYSDISIKINESIKANSQRHKHVNEQLDEAQQLIHKLFDHKEKFTNYLLMSSSDSKSLSNTEKMNINSNNNNHSSCSSIAPRIKSKGINSAKKGISTRSSQIKNSPVRSNIVRSAIGSQRGTNSYGSPKSSKS